MSGISVSIRDLEVGFSGRAVLEKVSLDVPERSITVIIGASGSGKTTLLRAINRLNEEHDGCTVSGQVLLHRNGETLDAYADLPVHELRKKAAMVFQSPNVFPCSIQKNILTPLRVVHTMGAQERRERMEMVLEEVDLWNEVRDRLHHNALTLSGGQQQRLCLARALALSPEILLLDEPTSSLDTRSGRRIEKLLTSLKDRYTILAVSHSIRQVRQIADKVIVISDGKVAKCLDRRDLDTPGLIDDLVEDVF
jgi:phosphate transport system ATP-binding protein